jgi:hypothetical protein
MISDTNTLKQSFEEEVKYNNLTIPYYIILFSKIDNQWTNIFWNYLLVLKKQITIEKATIATLKL